MHAAWNGSDLTGRRFGRLTVVRRLANDWNGNRRWHAVCDCGGFTRPTTANLRKGNTESCGFCGYRRPDDHPRRMGRMVARRRDH